MSARSVALVTGANRGLGRETARQLIARGWEVVVAARDVEQARAAARDLGPRAWPARLDVTRAEQAAEVAALVAERFGRLDALVNNAGAILEGPDSSTATVDPEVVLRTLDTNAVGALRVSQALLPLLLADGGGTITNVSSGMGGLAEMGGGWIAYRVSKTALNALTRLLHVEHHAAGLRVNSVCPGWVRTDMGGPGATRSVAEGAAGIVWAATLGPDGPSGGFFRDGQPVPW